MDIEAWYWNAGMTYDEINEERIKENNYLDDLDHVMTEMGCNSDKVQEKIDVFLADFRRREKGSYNLTRRSRFSKSKGKGKRSKMRILGLGGHAERIGAEILWFP